MTSVQRIADLTATLAGMSEAAADGAAVDLTGLDGAVAAAVSEVQTAPAREHARLRKTMSSLIEALDRLAATLVKQQNAAAQQRAAAAYGSAAADAPPPAESGGGNAR